MKQIIISGTSTRYQIKKAMQTKEPIKKRKVTTKWNSTLYDISLQKVWLMNIYNSLTNPLCNDVISTQQNLVVSEDNDESETDLLGQQLLRQEIEKKLSSYRHQDSSKKKKLEVLPPITFDETIIKMTECDLACYYCKETCLLFYENVREPLQWTLDRIDNTKGHCQNNVVICCLKCNLHRRNTNSNGYLFTRQLVLNKLGCEGEGI